MRTLLLDVNVLIALAWPVHVHHAATRNWFKSRGQRAWATCPLTQCAFVRISSNPAILRDAVRPEEALDLLKEMVRLPGHQFWTDDVSLTARPLAVNGMLTGHRQVTDAYLLSLAAHHGGAVATLDKGLMALASSSALVELIPP